MIRPGILQNIPVRPPHMGEPEVSGPSHRHNAVRQRQNSSCSLRYSVAQIHHHHIRFELFRRFLQKTAKLFLRDAADIPTGPAKNKPAQKQVLLYQRTQRNISSLAHAVHHMIQRVNCLRSFSPEKIRIVPGAETEINSLRPVDPVQHLSCRQRQKCGAGTSGESAEGDEGRKILSLLTGTRCPGEFSVQKAQFPFHLIRTAGRNPEPDRRTVPVCCGQRVLFCPCNPKMFGYHLSRHETTAYSGKRLLSPLLLLLRKPANHPVPGKDQQIPGNSPCRLRYQNKVPVRTPLSRITRDHSDLFGPERHRLSNSQRQPPVLCLHTHNDSLHAVPLRLCMPFSSTSYRASYHFPKYAVNPTENFLFTGKKTDFSQTLPGSPGCRDEPADTVNTADVMNLPDMMTPPHCLSHSTFCELLDNYPVPV